MYDREKDKFSSLDVTKALKLFVLKPSLSCSLCENDFCEIIIHSPDPNFECKYIEKEHEPRKAMYIEKAIVYMEYNLVPYIFVRDQEDLREINFTFSGSEKEPSLEITRSSSFNSYLAIFILSILTLSFLSLPQSQKKTKLKRSFFSTQRKKVREVTVVNHDAKQNTTRMNALVTSHKNVDTFLPRKEEQNKSLVLDESQWTYVTSRRWYSDC